MTYTTPSNFAGKGAYGVVWRATDRVTQQTVALKKCFDAFQNSTDAQRTYREIMFLQELTGYEGIITLYNVIKAKNDLDIYVITEYMESDLHAVIRANILQDVHRKYIVYQLVRTLKFLHSAGLVHRDIKPSNILLNSNSLVKICDFGLARSMIHDEDVDQPAMLTEYVATRWYRPPEILLGSSFYSYGVDIWSVGCIVVELHYGSPAFPGDSTLNQLEQICTFTGTPSIEDLEATNSPFAMSLKDNILTFGKNSPPITTLFPGAAPETYEIMKRTMVFNPEKRLTAAQCLKLNYVLPFPGAHPEPISNYKIQVFANDNVKLRIDDYRRFIYEEVDASNVEDARQPNLANRSYAERVGKSVLQPTPKDPSIYDKAYIDEEDKQKHEARKVHLVEGWKVQRKFAKELEKARGRNRVPRVKDKSLLEAVNKAEKAKQERAQREAAAKSAVVEPEICQQEKAKRKGSRLMQFGSGLSRNSQSLKRREDEADPVDVLRDRGNTVFNHPNYSVAGAPAQVEESPDKAVQAHRLQAIKKFTEQVTARFGEHEEDPVISSNQMSKEIEAIKPETNHSHHGTTKSYTPSTATGNNEKNIPSRSHIQEDPRYNRMRRSQTSTDQRRNSDVVPREPVEDPEPFPATRMRDDHIPREGARVILPNYGKIPSNPEYRNMRSRVVGPGSFSCSRLDPFVLSIKGLSDIANSARLPPSRVATFHGTRVVRTPSSNELPFSIGGNLYNNAEIDLATIQIPIPLAHITMARSVPVTDTASGFAHTDSTGHIHLHPSWGIPFASVQPTETRYGKFQQSFTREARSGLAVGIRVEMFEDAKGKLRLEIEQGINGKTEVHLLRVRSIRYLQDGVRMSTYTEDRRYSELGWVREWTAEDIIDSHGVLRGIRSAENRVNDELQAVSVVLAENVAVGNGEFRALRVVEHRLNSSGHISPGGPACVVQNALDAYGGLLHRYTMYCALDDMGIPTRVYCAEFTSAGSRMIEVAREEYAIEAGGLIRRGRRIEPVWEQQCVARYIKITSLSIDSKGITHHTGTSTRTNRGYFLSLPESSDDPRGMRGASGSRISYGTEGGRGDSIRGQKTNDYEDHSKANYAVENSSSASLARSGSCARSHQRPDDYETRGRPRTLTADRNQVQQYGNYIPPPPVYQRQPHGGARRGPQREPSITRSRTSVEGLGVQSRGSQASSSLLTAPRPGSRRVDAENRAPLAGSGPLRRHASKARDSYTAEPDRTPSKSGHEAIGPVLSRGNNRHSCSGFIRQPSRSGSKGASQNPRLALFKGCPDDACSDERYRGEPSYVSQDIGRSSTQGSLRSAFRLRARSDAGRE